MFNEDILKKATDELDRIGFVDTSHILSSEAKKKDFLLQIAAMIEYEVDITYSLIQRILSVIQMTSYEV